MTASRLILLPQGLPTREDSREHCCDLLLHCGGDLGRIHEGTGRSSERFAQQIAGIADVVNGREVPLVVFDGVGPAAEKILETRRVLEAEIAALERAPFVIYIDDREAATSLTSLQEWGSLDAPMSKAPLWTGPDARQYLVIFPGMHTDSKRALRKRVESAQHRPQSRSATRRICRDPQALSATVEMMALDPNSHEYVRVRKAR